VERHAMHRDEIGLGVVHVGVGQQKNEWSFDYIGQIEFLPAAACIQG
jgi:hypothetical protein